MNETPVADPAASPVNAEIRRDAGTPILEIRGLRKTFGSIDALASVDLTVAKGEFLTLLGPSGSGKSTLLKLIAGFDRPTGGELLLNGRDITRMSPASRGIGFVFQQYALFPHMTVRQNLAYGLKIRRWSKADRERRVDELIELLHLAGMGDRRPAQLSGGQQQRVALGRALAYDAELILMDEPLGALDQHLRTEMAAEMRRIHRELGATVIHVTHDQHEAIAMSDRVAVMRLGELVALDTPDHLFRRPPSAFVARMFSSCNLLPVDGYEMLGGDRARVNLLGTSIECPTTAHGPGEAVLAVRTRRISRAVPAHNALRIPGVVTEALLLGEDIQITLHVEGVGAVTAVLDAREGAGISIGDELTLATDASEATLVPTSP